MFNQVESIYSKCKWRYEIDPRSVEAIELAISQVDRAKHPGHPFGLLYNNNGLVIDALGVSGLTGLVMQRFEDLKKSPCGDLIRIFIKMSHTPRRRLLKVCGD